jgi:hypothetical protein
MSIWHRLYVLDTTDCHTRQVKSPVDIDALPPGRYRLSKGTIRMTFPDGTTQDVPSEVGVAHWADAEEHLPDNP